MKVLSVTWKYVMALAILVVARRPHAQHNMALWCSGALWAVKEEEEEKPHVNLDNTEASNIQSSVQPHPTSLGHLFLL